jgi:hypothetical protein
MRLDLDWHCPLMSQLTAYPVPRHIALLYQAQWLVNGLVLPERLASTAVSSLESIASKPSELYQRAMASLQVPRASPISKATSPPASPQSHTTLCRLEGPDTSINRHTNARDRHQSKPQCREEARILCFRRLHLRCGTNFCLSMANCPLRPARGNRAERDSLLFDTVALPGEGGLLRFRESNKRGPRATVSS